jgi:Protein of unknown function (DUF1573)
MRRVLPATFALVIFATTSALAQSPSWVSAVFPERSFDFGTVARGSKVRHAFKLVNSTGHDIHIADWRTKCGCTDVRVGTRDIPPGTQTVIEATVDTTKFQGYKASGLVLVLDKPSYAEVDLNLNCFIRSDVLLNPGQVDFGIVPRGSKQTVALSLTYAGAQPDWAVSKMQTVSALVTAQLRELSRSPGGQVQYQLTATLDPGAPPGFFKDEVALLTNDPSSPRIPITVSATIQAAVTVSPSILNLGRVRAGQEVKKTILVRSSQNQPFKITEVKSASGDITAASLPDQARPLQSVAITFKAPSQQGPFNTVLEIATDLKDEPPAKLNTFATIVP